MSEEKKPTCGVCGHPMPAGEEMFKYHGYSGPCPAPAKVKAVSETKLFRAEDFDGIEDAETDAREDAADAANARLAPLVEALERLERTWEAVHPGRLLEPPCNYSDCQVVAAYRALKGEG